MLARLVLALAPLMLLASCDSHEATHPDKCHLPDPDGKLWFAGTVECMRQLPQRRMSGVWVYGFESSVFYEGASRMPARAYSHDLEAIKTDVWLDTDPEDLLERRGLKFDGTTHAYRIDFIGTKSDAYGGYGHFGMFRRGALVQHILKIEEIPLR